MIFDMFQGKRNKKIAGIVIIVVAVAMVVVPLLASLAGW